MKSGQNMDFSRHAAESETEDSTSLKYSSESISIFCNYMLRYKYISEGNILTPLYLVIGMC